MTTPEWFLGYSQPGESDSDVDVVITGIREMTDTQVDELQRANDLIANLSANVLLQPLYQAANDLTEHALTTVAAVESHVFEFYSQTSLYVDQLLNQLPLFKYRLVRNVRLLIGEQAGSTIDARFKAEYKRMPVSPYRIMWDFRNAGQHAILPTAVMSVVESKDDDGNRVKRLVLHADKWIDLHGSGFPPDLRGSVHGDHDFQSMVGATLDFCEQMMSDATLIGADALDDAAHLILDLVGEIVTVANSESAVAPTVFSYSADGEFQRVPLDLAYAGGAILATDMARERAALPKKWNVD